MNRNSALNSDKMLNETFFLTGIGTDVGKTVVSAILAQALKAHYWKPVQAGDLDNSDSIKIGRLAPKATVLPEAFKLQHPMSPHAAANLEGRSIDLSELQVPQITGPLLIEGAGGLLVPFNNQGDTWLDWLKQNPMPIVLVSRHYLGSINHSLLTAKVLQDTGLIIRGWIFVGDENKDTEQIILSTTKVPMIARIPLANNGVDAEFVASQALELSLRS